MKKIKYFILISLILFILLLVTNFSKLNIVSGFSAKNMASSVFVAGRSLSFTDSTDNNFFPINLASYAVNLKNKTATATSLGLFSRKAIYREGLGCTLVNSDFKIESNHLQPKRLKPDNNSPFPYGNAEPKDSVFSNINYDKLNESVLKMFEPKNKTRAVLIIHKDKIVAEQYASGFDKNSKLLGWSMTKSITGTLLGILQFQGKINVFDKAPVSQWKNDERKNITIHNLLQMNSGLEWNEDYKTISDATKMLYLTDDMAKSQIEKKLIGKPNESWNYSSGTTNLLSGILRKQFATHQEYLDFWYTALIDKIGMNSMVVETDIKGNYIGSSYAWATARDWAKLGLLYLHNGNWKGTKIFNKEWVKYATNPTPTSNGSYGAQIWLNAGGNLPDVPKNMYSFNGYQGQYVFIFPTQELIIVRLGLTKNINLNKVLGNIVSAVKT